MDWFSQFHPLVSAVYFAIVLLGAMIVRHPAAQLVSLLCVWGYSKLARQQVHWKFYLPMVALAVLIQPFFGTQGDTLLLTFPWGGQLTWEGVLYGLSSGCMLLTVVLWFQRFSAVMTTDKFLYLFGTRLSALSLVLTMTFRFVPRFVQQLQTVVQAQKCIGRDVTGGKLHQRLQSATAILSVLLTWALENAMDTADSMKNRGYGMGKRSRFALYPFTRRDGLWLGALAVWGLGLIAGRKAFAFAYFPVAAGEVWQPWMLAIHLLYLLLCASPVLVHLWEERKWKL